MNGDVPITSTSTLSDARGEYLDNLGYEAARSVSMAQAFVAAIRALKVLLPSGSRHSTSGQEWNIAELDEELRAAREYIAANSSGNNGGVKHFSVENFRS